ncbi:MAG: hypothetical protein AB8B78_08130 [Polaribacter sp.]
MKTTLIVCTLLISYISLAQEAPKMPKYNAKNSANIFYYNYSEIPKKIKLKDDVKKNKTNSNLTIYNDKIKNIAFLNFSQLQELELTINSLGKQLYTNRDLAEMVREKIKKTILPIRDSVAVYEKTLNDSLKIFLSKKQFKKWLKYQRAVKKELQPKPPKGNNSPPPNMNRRRRNNQGLGGRGF